MSGAGDLADAAAGCGLRARHWFPRFSLSCTACVGMRQEPIHCGNKTLPGH